MTHTHVTTVVSTDLVTPLGAYLRLAREGGASFLLESVERGRLGRHSFVGRGSRLVDLAEAEACGEPVVGYLGYDYAATLEPTVPAPGRRPRPPGEPLRRRGRAHSLRPRPRPRGGLAGDPGRHRRAARRRASSAAAAQRLLVARPPRGASATSGSCGAPSDIRRGDAFQIVLLAAGRAADAGVAPSPSTARSGGSTRLRTCSCSSSTGSRSSARRRRRWSRSRARARA